MMKELTKVGLAAVENYPPIEDDDMEKLYRYFCQNLDDAQLLSSSLYNTILQVFAWLDRMHRVGQYRIHIWPIMQVYGSYTYVVWNIFTKLLRSFRTICNRSYVNVILQRMMTSKNQTTHSSS
jgi:hypothetical protein